MSDITWNWSPITPKPEPIVPGPVYRLNFWRRPRLMPLSDVCHHFGRSLVEVQERIADGRLPFTVVVEQQQVWVYRDEWDEWLNERIVQVTAPLARVA